MRDLARTWKKICMLAAWAFTGAWPMPGAAQEAGRNEGARPVIGRAVGKNWWSVKDLRIATYEFLEGMKGGSELPVEKILMQIRRLGGVDVFLCKGFQYYRGQFDESFGGLPRYKTKARQLIQLARRENIKIGVFGFTDRRKCYRGQPDYEKVLGAWKEYVDMGADLLFVDEESGKDGLDIPDDCVAYCDELRARFKLPVGIFFYGDASRAAPLVKRIAGHVDVIGEMSYSLYLDKPGDYSLARVTKECSAAARSVNAGIAYWTGAGIFGEKEFPGLPGTSIWRDRYGDRDEAGYFHDYMKVAIENGATGVYYHSTCRTTWWAEDRQKRIMDGISRVFKELEGRVDNAQESPKHMDWRAPGGEDESCWKLTCPGEGRL